MITFLEDHSGESRDLTGKQNDWRGSIFGKGESNQGHCRERTAWDTAGTMERSGHVLCNNPSSPLYPVKMCCSHCYTKMIGQWLGRIWGIERMLGEEGGV